MEHQILRYIGFDATSLMNLPEAKIRKIARYYFMSLIIVSIVHSYLCFMSRRENIPRYASKEAYRILDKCYFTRLCLDLDPILCAIACLYYAEHTVGGYKTTSHTINGSNNSSNYSSSGGKDFDSQISKRQKVDEIDHRTIWSSSRWWLLYEAVDESELERLRQQMMSSFNQ